MSGSARRRWLLAWPGGALIGVVNGVLREATYGRRVPERTANQLSGVTAVAAFGAYFSALQARWPLRSRRDAVEVGAGWLGLTVAFEFGFGHLVAKLSWDELLEAYDVTAGRMWPLVLAWIGAGPAVVRALRTGPEFTARTLWLRADAAGTAAATIAAWQPRSCTGFRWAPWLAG